jgi:hypothetical protein
MKITPLAGQTEPNPIEHRFPDVRLNWISHFAIFFTFFPLCTRHLSAMTWCISSSVQAAKHPLHLII